MYAQNVHESIWKQPLEGLYGDLAAPRPAPAAVTAAAVCARLGLALLIKSLEVVGRRKSFAGDREQLGELLEAARVESQKLAEVADEDIVAGEERRRSEVPVRATRAAEAALALCGRARPLITGAVAADLESAVLLLQGATRAVRVCMHTNTAGDRQTRP